MGWGTGFFYYRFKGGFEKHCTRASLHSHSGRSDQNQCRGRVFEKHCTRASLHSDTVEDLIRIRGASLEDFDARESVASWFSQGQRSRRTNYRSWPSEGHVTAMEDSP